MSAASRHRRRAARLAEQHATAAAADAAWRALYEAERTRVGTAARLARRQRLEAWRPPAPVPPLALPAGTLDRDARILDWLAAGHDMLLRLGSIGLGARHGRVIDYAHGSGGDHDECLICGALLRRASHEVRAHVDEHAEQWLAEQRYVVPGRYADRDVLADALCAAFEHAAAALGRIPLAEALCAAFAALGPRA